jgi:hypothetical protein
MSKQLSQGGWPEHFALQVQFPKLTAVGWAPPPNRRRAHRCRHSSSVGGGDGVATPDETRATSSSNFTDAD